MIGLQYRFPLHSLYYYDIKSKGIDDLVNENKHGCRNGYATNRTLLSVENLIVSEAVLTISTVTCSFSPVSEANETINFVCLTISFVCLIMPPEHGFSARNNEVCLTISCVCLITSPEHRFSVRNSEVCLTNGKLCLIMRSLPLHDQMRSYYGSLLGGF